MHRLFGCSLSRSENVDARVTRPIPIVVAVGGDEGGVGGREDSGIRTRSDIITCMDEALARRQGWPIEVHPLHDRDASRREREYWMSRTPAERMEALDRLREERDGPQPRLARVARVIERKRR